MSNYSLTTFVNPLSSTDKLIKVYDNNLVVKWQINPFTVKNVFVLNNLLKVSLNSDRTITLDFSSTNEAKLALPIIKSQIETLVNEPPLRIDKIVEEYVGPIGIDNNLFFIGTTQSVVGTSSTASATASYLQIQVNGINYKIPLFL